MFNIKSFNVLHWYSIFIKFDYNFLFLVAFVYCFLLIFFCKNNVNFFFNILLFLIIVTCFLFKINVGAYAGFLFLCESVSVFTLFIILNRISNDDLIVTLHTNLLKITAIIIFSYFTFISYRYYTYTIQRSDLLRFFTLELHNSNDFWSITVLFFTNTYSIHLLVCVFIILISFLIIVAVYYSGQSLANVLGGKFTINSLINSHINNLFKNNNNMFFKKCIIINFFKK